MTTGLLQIGSSALDAAYTALRTTGNNIANVNTPGYNREVTNFSAQTQTNVGSEAIGTGVTVQSVTRVYNDFLAQQTNLAQSLSSGADSTVNLTGEINTLFSNSSNGLGAVIDNFFNQMQQVAAQPNSAAARTTALSAGQEMASQFNNLYSQLQTMSQGAVQQINQQVATINTTVAQIGQLNSQIALAQAGGQTPNALLDQRDQDLQTLNQSLGVSRVVDKNDGSYDLFLANGHPLLVGDQSYPLQVGLDPNNGQSVIVGTTSGGTTIAALDPNNSGGGTLGSLLLFQNQTLPDVENQIGRLAAVLSSQINGVQTTGTDANGNAGAAFFTTPTASTVASTNNTGSAALQATISDVTQLQASDYQLADNAGTITLTRLSDGQVFTPPAGFPASAWTVDGMTLNQTGTMNSGDVFTIEPVQFGAQNIGVLLTQGSQVSAASPLQANASTQAGSTLAVGSVAPAVPPALPSPPSGMLGNLTLTFAVAGAATTYSYTDPSTGLPQTGSYVPGQPINVNGWSLVLNGQPVSGDTVTVGGGGTSGSGDNRNMLSMAALQQQNLVGTTGSPGTGTTIDGAYASVVGNVGALAGNALTDQASKNSMLSAATTAQSSLSGVNLDEEAAKLMQYQQQYQAAAQLIQTAGTIFTTILSAASAA